MKKFKTERSDSSSSLKGTRRSASLAFFAYPADMGV